MFKKISGYSLLSLALPFISSAQTDVVSPILSNLTNAIRILVSLAFLLALLMFAWGIVKLIAAAGDPEKIKAAKGYILWGIVGLAVLASIFGLIQFLQQYFGVSGGSGSIPVPSVL